MLLSFPSPLRKALCEMYEASLQLSGTLDCTILKLQWRLRLEKNPSITLRAIIFEDVIYD